ncbi:type IV secretion protein Dot [Legionella maioricensis]|uniref:Type IV secretion protein Dot n=1 Tax=Legionella maioricensis TaxID=2896528 RepID=A0A9X2IEF2_9GAMM|nr:type IV secretion protein Dot [Legionella maioricensis]MCL9685778.1 type IV secretion protein Dot [Legionella maioricensis]MCL9689182.1 type IV secretion protein Dot [Legionella maioricensis]
MTFTPPQFPILNVNTLNLDTALSTLLGRYKIVDPTESGENQSSLRLLIARTQQVLDCKSDRVSQREVFNTLVNELREVLKEKDEEKHKRGTQFLLGALLHRYFRLISLYDSWNYSFYKSDPRSCRLFLAIRAALNLPDAKSDDYREKDLEILDVTTIVTALESFRDNMQLKDVKQMPRFKKYHHFAVEDPNFEKNLDEIIEKYKIIAAPLLKQFKAIDFIQSLAKKVADEHGQIEQALTEWNKVFVKEHMDFDSLNSEIIALHISKHISPVSLREKVLDLLYTPYIQSEMKKPINHKLFFEAMKKSNDDTASYEVFGGYALLLQSAGIEEQLRFCIDQALGGGEKPTDQNMLNGLKFLKQFIKENPSAILNCEFFGGKDKMDTQLAQNLKGLTEKIARKSEESTESSTLVH